MSTDTDTSAPDTDRDTALNEIITATGAAVADDVDNAVVVFRADGEGVRQVATDIRIGDHRVTIDEPPTLGGENTDPNPVETALAGLLSCQVVTYRLWAAKLGVPFDRIHIETRATSTCAASEASTTPSAQGSRRSG
jgi:OsmC-like protein